MELHHQHPRVLDALDAFDGAVLRPGDCLQAAAEGLFAQALQHEIDHLDGHLYIDRMDSLDKLQRSEPIRKREADEREARRAAGEEVEEEELEPD